MLDVEPVIIAELERVAAVPAREPNWGDVLARAKTSSAAKPTRTRRLFVLGVAVAVATAIVAVALAAVFGGFSTWLTGEPGKPASSQAQAAFDRSIRSWQGFPRSTQLRELITTSVGKVHYTLYGFRGAGSLCLRLVVTGTPSGTELACAPLNELRTRRSPALVLASDLTLGNSGRIVSQGPLSLPASRVAVSFGVVADGVNRIEVAHQTPAPTRTIVSGDAFLAVSPGLSPFNATTRITAFAGKAHASVPFAQQPTPYNLRAAPVSMPSPTGPATVQRQVKGGAIGWFARRQPRGQAVPANLHDIVAVKPDVIFARMLTPDPSAPERVVVSIRPAGHAYFGGRLRNKQQVCAELVGGRYSGGGCWPAGRLFSTAPFAWWVTEQPGGQIVTISGVASDQVTRMTLFSATGNTEPVPLHDNTYLALGTLADYPLRLVAYDQDGRSIGIKTFKGAYAAPAGPAPAPGARWRQVLTNSAGAVYTVRSTSGGTCVGFRESAGVATFGCDQSLGPNTLALSTGTGDKDSFILGRTGSGIVRITISLRRGQTLTVTPNHGYVLLQLPYTSRDPSAGVAEVRGFDKTGRMVAHETFRR
ncbi:MAG: hypothetical protein ABSB24_03885 [Gaiellaceae bacterium]|jgi:hypothetical protein